MGIEELRKEILEEAEKRINGMLEEARAEADRIIKEAEQRAGQIVEGKKEALLKSLKEKERSELAISRIEGKRLILSKKWSLVDEVFNRVAEKLRGIRESKDYEDVMASYIADAVKSLAVDEVLLMVNDDDHKMFRSKLNSIEKRVSEIVGRRISLNLSDKKPRIIGGVIVTDMSGMLIYNSSFDAKMVEAREKLAADVLNILFGEEV